MVGLLVGLYWFDVMLAGYSCGGWLCCYLYIECVGGWWDCRVNLRLQVVWFRFGFLATVDCLSLVYLVWFCVISLLGSDGWRLLLGLRDCVTAGWFCWVIVQL